MMTNDEILLERAKNNDTKAMFELGMIEYFSNKNYDQSLTWFKKSYENGHKEAALGLVFVHSKMDNVAQLYWGNVVLQNFGNNYSKEEDNYSLWTCIPQITKETKHKVGDNYSVSTTSKKQKNKLEIGIGYKENDSHKIFKSISFSLKDLMENKYIYDETIEKELSGLCLYSDADKVIPLIEEIYNETKYPGALYLLGEIYFYGYCNLNINETKGIEYFEKAAQEGYSRAQSILSNIYLGKASQYIYKAYKYYDENYNTEKMMVGNCLIADYLIGISASHYNHYDQYFDGLTKLTESSHEGCDEATFILNVLGKDKLTKRMYKKGLEKEKNKFSNYLDYYYEIDFDEYEDFDFEDLDEE